MKSFIIPSLHFYIFLFLNTHLSSLIYGYSPNLYASCSNIFSCGAITGIGYPFYGGDRPVECGYPGLELDCDDDIITTIESMNVKYRVLAINQETQILTLTREDLLEDTCLEEFLNTTFDSRLFEYASDYTNLTFFYGCSNPVGPVERQFDCPINGISDTIGYVQIGVDRVPGTCHASVVVPVKNTNFRGIGDLGQLLARGFEVGWKLDKTACDQCKNSSGRCRHDQSLNEFRCLCANQSSVAGTCLGLEIDGRVPQQPENSPRLEMPPSTEESSAPPVPDAAAASESESKSESG